MAHLDLRSGCVSRTGCVVACRGLSRKFHDEGSSAVVLDDLDFDVQAGDSVAIFGKSGCGKTTLLSILGAIDVHYDGSVRLLGNEARTMSDRARSALRRQIGFVFQNHHVLPHLTTLQNVLVPTLFGPEIPGAVQRARETLERLGLSAHENDTPRVLSGGERQRVAIARALIARPKLLIADEPTANLDEQTAMLVIDVLRDLNVEQGTTLVISTHDSRLAAMVRRRLRLEHGRLDELILSTMRGAA